jgi:hypothetical protein
MSRSAPATRGRHLLGALGVAVLVALGLGACGAAQPRAPTPQPAPLATSLPSTAGTWALVPIGTSSGEGRFWELLWLRAGTAHWSLVTPPGVQDNGGLSIASAPADALLAGFLPSINLHFSPLARTTDHGATWSPDLLEYGLASTPDSLAVDPQGALFALVPQHGGEVLARAHQDTPWRTLVSASTLARAPAAHGCALKNIGAITVSAAGQLTVSGSCALAGQIGEYVEEHRRWRAAAPTVPAALRQETANVLRLTSTPAGTFSMIKLTAPADEQLIAAWSSDGGESWAHTPALSLDAGQRLISTGPGPGRGAYLLTEAITGAKTIWTTAGPGASWHALPPPPAGTTTVAPLDSSRVEAFVTHNTTISDWRLERGRWRRQQTIHVLVE